MQVIPASVRVRRPLAFSAGLCKPHSERGDIDPQGDQLSLRSSVVMQRLWTLRRVPVLLTITMLVGGAVLFHALDSKSFWGDEIITVRRSQLDLYSLLKGLPQIDVHPPMYYLMTHYWALLSGKTESSLRLLSAIFGLANLFFIYKIGNALFNRRIGLLACYLSAISPFLILYSRMARSYSLVAFLSLLSILFLIKVIQEGRILLFISYILITSLLIYTHYIGLLLIIGQNILFMICYLKKQCRLKVWVISQMAIFVLYLPWITAFYQTVSQGQGVYKDIDEFTGLLGASVKFLYALYSYNIGETVYPWNAIIVLPMVIYFIVYYIGAMALIRNQSMQRLFFISIFIIPLLLYIICSELYVMHYALRSFIHLPRILIFLAPICYIFNSYAISQLKSKEFQLAVILVVSLFNIYALQNYFLNKQFVNPNYIVPWPEVVDYIDRHAEKDDVVVSVEAPLRYYGQRLNVRSIDEGVAEAVANPQSGGIRRLWLLSRERGDIHWKQQVRQFQRGLEAHFRLIDTQGFMATPGEARDLWQKILQKELPRYYINIFLYARPIEP